MGTILRRGDLPPPVSSLSRDRSAGNKSLEMHPPFREPFVLRTLVGHWRDLENERSCGACVRAWAPLACTHACVNVSSPLVDRRSLATNDPRLHSLFAALGRRVNPAACNKHWSKPGATKPWRPPSLPLSLSVYKIRSRTHAVRHASFRSISSATAAPRSGVAPVEPIIRPRRLPVYGCTRRRVLHSGRMTHAAERANPFLRP